MSIQKRKDNYFDINLRDHDENFINNKSNMDIQKDAKKRIFKDMIFGNIDYDVHGAFFTNPNFIDILLNTAKVEEQKHEIQFVAVDMYARSTNNQNTSMAYTIANQHYECGYALKCIVNALETLKMNNYDISSLTKLTIDLSALPNCRKNYNEFY